jgi:hypothetical protein
VANKRLWNKRDGRAPEGSVYIGRPTVFGNPFTHLELPGSNAVKVDTREDAVAAFERYLHETPRLQERILRELRGKVLVCWCAPKKCHGEVILKFLDSNNQGNLFDGS